MTNTQFKEILVKTAKYIDSLTAENASLREELAKQGVFHKSAESLSEIANITGMDTDKVYDTLKSMTPEQRRLMEKLSEVDFQLGGASEAESVEESADEKFVNFMRY